MLPTKNKNGKLPMVLRKKLPARFEKIKNKKLSSCHEDYSIHLYLQDNDITVQRENSEIINFLKGKNVLVTGATGFLGKLFVEKLLRCDEDIMVFILVREKKGKTVEQRVEEMLDSYVFHKLSKIHPNFRKNVVGINGDISLPDLGLTEESRNVLTEKVNIIYHAAATVRFDEKLKKAVQTNILGTKAVIKLARECKDLAALVYVSTAYSNCHLQEIREEFYEPTLKPDHLIHLVETLPEETLEKITPGLITPMPNTYSFTKQITENLIRSETSEIPTCICRPSIVLSASREPFKGWGDNLFGPIGYMLAVALGIVHVQKCCPEKRSDIVPADFVINNCIAASFKTAQEGIQNNPPKIYNIVSQQNPIKWKESPKLTGIHGSNIGSVNSISDFYLVYTPNKFFICFIKILCHRIPAYVLDFAAICVERKPRLNAVYDKIDKFGDVLSFFTMHEWNFDSKNTTELWDSLNEVDKKNFNFDIKSLDWKEYFTVFLLALREFILQEFLDNIDQSRKHQMKLRVLRYVLQTLLTSLGIFVIYKTILLLLNLI